jgi:hypothetical protein
MLDARGGVDEGTGDGVCGFAIVLQQVIGIALGRAGTDTRQPPKGRDECIERGR